MGNHYHPFHRDAGRKPESGTEERPDVDVVSVKAEEGSPLGRLHFTCCMLGFK